METDQLARLHFDDSGYHKVFYSGDVESGYIGAAWKRSMELASEEFRGRPEAPFLLQEVRQVFLLQRLERCGGENLLPFLIKHRHRFRVLGQPRAPPLQSGVFPGLHGWVSSLAELPEAVEPITAPGSRNEEGTTLAVSQRWAQVLHPGGFGDASRFIKHRPIIPCATSHPAFALCRLEFDQAQLAQIEVAVRDMLLSNPGFEHLLGHAPVLGQQIMGGSHEDATRRTELRAGLSSSWHLRGSHP